MSPHSCGVLSVGHWGGSSSPVSTTDTSVSGVAGDPLVSTFSLTNWRSSIQKVRVNRSCGDRQ